MFPLYILIFFRMENDRLIVGDNRFTSVLSEYRSEGQADFVDLIINVADASKVSPSLVAVWCQNNHLENKEQLLCRLSLDTGVSTKLLMAHLSHIFFSHLSRKWVYE